MPAEHGAGGAPSVVGETAAQEGPLGLRAAGADRGRRLVEVAVLAHLLIEPVVFLCIFIESVAFLDDVRAVEEHAPARVVVSSRRVPSHLQCRGRPPGRRCLY